MCSLRYYVPANPLGLAPQVQKVHGWAVVLRGMQGKVVRQMKAQARAKYIDVNQTEPAGPSRLLASKVDAVIIAVQKWLEGEDRPCALAAGYGIIGLGVLYLIIQLIRMVW